MGKLDQVFLNWNMRHRGKVDAPFLSLATHSVCRRGRCSHPSKTTSGSKTRKLLVTFVCTSNLSYGPILKDTIAIIMIVQIHPCWCRQWQYSGGNEAWKEWKGGAWTTSGGPPPATAALCKQLIYAHILCIAGLDYSRRSPGWIIPIHNRAGRFPQITRQDYQAGLFPIEYVTSYFVLETTYLIFVTGTTGCACGEKVCDEEKFKIFMWRNPAT